MTYRGMISLDRPSLMSIMDVGFKPKSAISRTTSTCLRFQLTLQQVRVIVQFRLRSRRSLEHRLLPLQDLKTPLRRTQIPTDHQQISISSAVAAHQRVRLDQAHGRHGQSQPGRRGRGVAAHEVHFVHLTRQPNPCHQLVDGLHGKPVAQPKAHHYLVVAFIAQTSLRFTTTALCQVLEWRVTEVVDALAEHVCGDDHPLPMGSNTTGVVSTPRNVEGCWWLRSFVVTNEPKPPNSLISVLPCGEGTPRRRRSGRQWR